MSSLLSIADRLLRWSAVVLLLTLLASVLIGVVSRQLNAPLAWTRRARAVPARLDGVRRLDHRERQRAHIRITVFARPLPAAARSCARDC